MTTHAGSQATDKPKSRPSRFGIRIRILLALLFASAPGIAFGLIEAQRTFQSAVERNAADLRQTNERVRAIVEQTIVSAGDAARILSMFAIIADNQTGCQALFRSTAASDRYAAAGRINARGQIVCSNHSEKDRMEADDERLEELRSGAPIVISALTSGAVSREPVVVVTVPMKRRGDFDGGVFVSIRQSFLAQALSSAAHADTGVFLMDQSGTVIVAQTGPRIDAAKALDAARRAIASGEPISVSGLNAVGSRAYDGLRVAVVRPLQTVNISVRAALIALAPVIGVTLGMGAIWAALDVWVLQWINALGLRARQEQAEPLPRRSLTGAPPPEVLELSDAFDANADAAQQRENDLNAALDANQQLTRELHHRVKNNLQILLSLIARQQKRADAPATREALGQARARMMAIAMVHRFIDPPEHLGSIDLDAYLGELCRQLVTALDSTGRNLRIAPQLEPDTLTVDAATALGLFLAEAVILIQTHQRPALIAVVWRASPRRLAVQLAKPFEAPLESDLLSELARQVGADLSMTGEAIALDWR